MAEPAKETVQFFSDGVPCAGWFYPANSNGQPSPGLVFCPGYGGTKYAAFYQPYVERFVENGYSVMIIDYRGWGESEGERGVINPFYQVEDARSALTYLETRPEIDPKRLGLFGVSFGGGVVSYAAGVDERVQATVSVSGIADGAAHLRGKRREYEWQEFLQTVKEDQFQRVTTGKSAMVKAQGDISIPTPERLTTTVKGNVPEGMVPELSPLHSANSIIDFRPIEQVHKIAPRAIMWFYVTRDTAASPENSISMYLAADEPKKLVKFEGSTHYGLYLDEFEEISTQSLEWYNEHMGKDHVFYPSSVQRGLR